MKKIVLLSLFLMSVCFVSKAQKTIVIYEHPDKKGRSCNITTSQPDLRLFCGNWDDIISSVSVDSGYEIVFYEHPNYEGQSWGFTSYVGDLRFKGCDNTASSIKVYYRDKLK